MPIAVRLLLLLPLIVACADEIATCEDGETRRLCEGDTCRFESCRGDERCGDGLCVPWTGATLAVDFDVEEVPGNPLKRLFRVHPEGFPRTFTEEVRFDFGDGRAGHGEEVAHRFADGGVYPVTLTVMLRGYRVLQASRLVVVLPIPSDAPPIQLTVNETPAAQNGSLPFRSNAGTPGDSSDDSDESFVLLLPSEGFTIDLTLLDAPGREVRRDTLTLVADRPIGRAAAGTDLSDRLVFPTDPVQRVPHARWQVSASDAFPDGDVTLTATATLADGTQTSTRYGFRVHALTEATDPFEKTLVWLLRFDMDLFTIAVTRFPNGEVGLAATPGANGIPDFLEDLRAIGAQGGETGAGAATLVVDGRVGVNAVYLALVKERVIESVRRVFHIAPDGSPRDGIALDFYADGQVGAPDPMQFSEDGPFSMMRIGGQLPGAFGRSTIWYFNTHRSNDSTLDLGVASTSLIGLAAGGSLLDGVFGALKPGPGTPVGDDPLDAVVLAASFDRWAPGGDDEANARWDALQAVATVLADTLAPVIAHEMGHAMGLMPRGAPPFGFFADRQDASIVEADGTDDAHTNFPGLNIMQAGGNPIALIGELGRSVDLPPGIDTVGVYRIVMRELRLCAYERAYLQRRQTHLR